MKAMVEEKPFAIEIGAPCSGGGSSEPEWGALDELPSSEVSFQRFCFEHNHEVDVRVGTKEKTILLFPDVVLAYPELIDIPRRLRQNIGVAVTFPEHMFELMFEPRSDGVECRMQEFGYQHGSASCLAGEADVEAAVAGFIDNLRALVVGAGYLMPETPSR
jgi:hypothetical protein